jgi:hypothetical protein
MVKQLVCALACSVIAGTAVLAHHSYGTYDREHPLTIEGTIEQLTIGNPHAILIVRTDDGQVFTAEWNSAMQLTRSGFVAGMLTAGDRVIVSGAPSRDPELHRLALVSRIARPSDGWQWTRSGVVTATHPTAAPAPVHP